MPQLQDKRISDCEDCKFKTRQTVKFYDPNEEFSEDPLLIWVCDECKNSVDIASEEHKK